MVVACQGPQPALEGDHRVTDLQQTPHCVKSSHGRMMTYCTANASVLLFSTGPAEDIP
jgi:hypothetical protein